MSSSVVLGGGIAGLSAAYYLSKINCSVKLVEASNRLGGWIHSSKNKNGTIYEAGPRTMRIVGEVGINTLELLEDLNLSDQVNPVLKSSPAAKNRMLYVNGKLHSLPNSIGSLFKTMPPFSKPLITSVLHDLRSPVVELEDDTIHNFVTRRFGSEMAEYSMGALVSGVCAGDARQISVNLLMGRLFEWEQQHGGVIKGLLKTAFSKSSKEEGPRPKRGALSQRVKNEGWSVWSLKGGLEKLPVAMGKALESSKNVEISLNSSCLRIEFTPSEVKIDVNGRLETTEHAFCALPALSLAKILPKEHEALQKELLAIPFVTVGVVNLEYSGNVLPVDGFGFLVPPNQKLPILGVIFDTCCFPQEGKTVLTVMMGGAWFSQLFGESPEPGRLLDIAVEQVNAALGISQPPSDSKVNILKDCIPQYVVGHKARVQRIRRYIAGRKLPLTLLGSSYDGVGVNDVIYSARKAVHSRFA